MNPPLAAPAPMALPTAVLDGVRALVAQVEKAAQTVGAHLVEEYVPDMCCDEHYTPGYDTWDPVVGPQAATVVTQVWTELAARDHEPPGGVENTYWAACLLDAVLAGEDSHIPDELVEPLSDWLATVPPPAPAAVLEMVALGAEDLQWRIPTEADQRAAFVLRDAFEETRGFREMTRTEFAAALLT